MWKQLFKALKYIITFADKLQKLEARAKEQSEQIRRLADNQARMYYEFQLQRERDARERERAENAALRLENQQLREQLTRSSLPPQPQHPKPHEDHEN